MKQNTYHENVSAVTCGDGRSTRGRYSGPGHPYICVGTRYLDVLHIRFTFHKYPDSIQGSFHTAGGGRGSDAWKYSVVIMSDKFTPKCYGMPATFHVRSHAVVKAAQTRNVVVTPRKSISIFTKQCTAVLIGALSWLCVRQSA